MKPSLADAIARFGKDAEAKLSSRSVTGEPEDQLRAPFEQLIRDMAALCGLASDAAVSSGESSVAALHTRPDNAMTANGALVGFAELKAPGKGADPRRMKVAHDKNQWVRLQCLHLGSQPGDGQPVAASVVRIVWTSHALGDLGRLHAFLEPMNPPAAAAVSLSLPAPKPTPARCRRTRPRCAQPDAPLRQRRQRCNFISPLRKAIDASW